ncbi:winged helix-turn-helix domain-containing protein [Pseudomonas aeruginosa]|uniref:winged helix-turn-helix domain-containing protein n=1 Tax=Pseudomonas aeruginosa TaxID=287 RepID=UPI002258F77B|nr:winged helix-turn-helix domain-containing protein [Pseudomonas aeruginosa]MCX4212100.1 winged helix-turn-helix domain-containing protein [Pseudomonas aeruginosa]MCX4230977.1 winged helix-turn-helix domain-containing protein [Pseudomonas aeruginosa]
MIDASGTEYTSYLSLPEARALSLLIESHGEVISRDRLIAHAWSGRPVSHGSLNQAIFNIRRAFSPLDGHAVIRTEAGQGYCANIYELIDDNAEHAEEDKASPRGKDAKCNGLQNLKKLGAFILLAINAILVLSCYKAIDDVATLDLSYNFYTKKDGVEYWASSSLPQGQEYVGYVIEMLQRYPPRFGVANPASKIYINASINPKNVNCFFCSGSLTEEGVQCFSYMLTVEGADDVAN